MLLLVSIGGLTPTSSPWLTVSLFVNEGARAPGTTEYDILQERRNGILEIVIVLGWKDWFNRYFPTENNHYF